ncbi:Calx-beta domain-containing protein, partial [Saonia flava]
MSTKFLRNLFFQLAFLFMGYVGFGQTVSIADVSFAEANTVVTFEVTYSGPLIAPFDVDYLSSNDTAIAGSDYVAVSGTLNFTGNNPETQTFNVNIASDLEPEIDETYNITLSNITGGVATILDGTAVGTIINDDGVSVTFSSATGSDTETSGGNLPTLFITGTVTAATSVTVTDALTGSATGGGTDYSFSSPQ